jgi:hypothetical protein
MGIKIEDELRMISSDSLTFNLTSAAALFGILSQITRESPGTAFVAFFWLFCLASILMAAIRTRSGITRIKKLLLKEIAESVDASVV